MKQMVQPETSVITPFEQEFGSQMLQSNYYQRSINFEQKKSQYKASVIKDKDQGFSSGESDNSFTSKASNLNITSLSPEEQMLINDNVRWNWLHFFEFLFYHFVFFFLLGPFMTLFLWWKPGVILMKNMEFKGLTAVNLIQTFIYFTNLYCSVQFYLDKTNTLHAAEMVYLWGLIFNLCIIISAKYATFSKDQIRIYKTHIIEVQQKKKLQYLHFFTPQSAEAKYLELRAALKRHQFELSLFYVTFFTVAKPPFSETINSLNEELQKQHKSVTDIYQPTPLRVSMFKQQFYGFGIANRLIQEFEAISSWRSLVTQAIILSLGMSLISILYSIHSGILYRSGYHMFFFLFMVVSESYCGFVCLLFLLTSLRDIKKQKFFSIQCGFMLSPRKALWDDKKIIPTLNITDSQSIMAWSMLRQIFSDYGKQYTIRTQAFYSFIIIYCLVVSGSISLHFFGLFEIDNFSMIYLSAGDFIFFALLIQVLVGQAQNNEFFQIYRNQLEDWINIVQDIQTMRPFYFHKRIPSNNYLHQKIVQFVLEQIKDFDEAEEYLTQIQLNLEDAVRHIDYDERNSSSKFYGFVVTFEKLWAIVLTLGTIVGFNINYLIKHE